jgi:hypothetical protein
VVEEFAEEVPWHLPTRRGILSPVTEAYSILRQFSSVAFLLSHIRFLRYLSQPCPTQYSFGTKLMCYEDDDPSKPVRIQIVGSRWRKDQLMGKQAVYVIQRQGDNIEVYNTTEFTSAHEEDPEIGWSLGWDVPFTGESPQK